MTAVSSRQWLIMWRFGTTPDGIHVDPMSVLIHSIDMSFIQLCSYLLSTKRYPKNHKISSVCYEVCAMELYTYQSVQVQDLTD